MHLPLVCQPGNYACFGYVYSDRSIAGNRDCIHAFLLFTFGPNKTFDLSLQSTATLQ